MGNQSLLWVIALAGGALGLLLLSLASLAAMYLNSPSASKASKKQAQPEKSQPHGGSIASKEQPAPPVDASSVNHSSLVRVGPWAWIKAWIFAIIHASTVSVVLGGITFFQDLARASEEIQSTGTVSFPKQLLPGTLSMPSRRQLSEPSAESETGDRHWEVEDLVNEAGVGQN